MDIRVHIATTIPKTCRHTTTEFPES